VSFLLRGNWNGSSNCGIVFEISRAVVTLRVVDAADWTHGVFA
jgi:GTP-dependent phosphoenolpyruvate carboxykinase